MIINLYPVLLIVGLISYVEYLFLLCILTGKLAVLYQVVYTYSLSAQTTSILMSQTNDTYGLIV